MVSSQPSLNELRPALEHALAESRNWAKKHNTPMPGRVQELVNSRRRSLPDNWAATMRRALEFDAGFRAEVAESASEASVGPVGWLWLVRPDGWSKEIAKLRSVADAEDTKEKDERLAVDRLAVTERRLAKAEKDIERLQKLNAENAAEMARLRQARDSTTSRAREAEEAWRTASAERDRLTELVASLRKSADLDARRYEKLQADLRESTLEAARRSAAARQADEARSAAEARLSEVLADGARRAEQTDRLIAQIGENLGRAAAAAEDLGPALTGALALLGLQTDERANKAGQQSKLRGGVSSSVPSRRGPLTLPPGIFDDSVEAVEFLLRVQGVNLIVDGYNVGLTSWPGHELPALRDRLVSALAELILRVRLTVEVIFDGDGDGGRVPPPRAVRSHMTVLFSASNVEADHEIILAVERLGVDKPVVVATDDRAVRDAARLRGANVISVAQLLKGLSRRTSLK